MPSSRYIKQAFAYPRGHTNSYRPKTLVWRRITPADCVARSGPTPPQDRVDRLMDKTLAASAWRAIGDRDAPRKAQDPLGPATFTRRRPPTFRGQLSDLYCEEKITEDLRRYRLYHPLKPGPLRLNIIFIPPPAPSPFQPNRVIPILSDRTHATIITPLPPDTVRPFPQPLHELIRIYDECGAGDSESQTAIVSAGIAAPFAASIAMTEPRVKALGIWGGIMDLTVHAERATAWNRQVEKWEHYEPPPPPSPSTAVTGPPALAITEAEFCSLRRNHFPNPETWTDPFASPQMFFRSPGVEFSRLTLKEIWGKNALAEWNRDKLLEEIEELEAQSRGEDADASFIFPRRQSRVHQDFPPEKRETQFPRVRLVLPAEGSGDGDDVAMSQGRAFAEVYRSNLTRWFKLYHGGVNEEEVANTVEAKTLVENLIAGETFEDEIYGMGRWLKWALGKNDTW